MIAALFVDARGVYARLPGVECWDRSRDARTYAGPHRVVAHPPCTRWCRLAKAVQGRYGHAPGDDEGCFASALASVRRFGGVLEHPAESLAWPAFGLRTPHRPGGWLPTRCGGWVCSIEQGMYGHRARKTTWLYVIGERPPELRWGRSVPTATVSYMTNHGGGDLPRLSKREASATPLDFALTLITIASAARSDAIAPSSRQ